MSDPIVRFEMVSKSYDGRGYAVRDLDLAIAPGEFLTLLGPSGSGKTTSLMMLAGFETPTTGRIWLEGREVARVPPHRRGLGMVFQNYALFPHLTVAENVAFPLSVRHVAAAEIATRVGRALDMVQLAGLGERRPGQLSGGQQQRVALARALVYDPKLVLLDEPLGALDKQLREEMQDELKRLHATLGVTMVYVTHDQGEALTLSDRIAVFRAGALQQLGAPRTLYDAPANAFVAGFIGESNRVAGTLVAADTDRCSVRAGDALIHGTPTVPLAPGASVVLSLRPEQLRLDPAPADFANLADAVVEALTYLGDHTRVRLTFWGRDDWVAKLPAERDRPGLAPGARIRVGFRAVDARVFASMD